MEENLPVDKEHAKISRKGFFFESKNHSITWQFDAECIISNAYFPSGATKAEQEIRRLQNCIPFFRQEYLKAWWGGFKVWGDWLLIRKLQMLEKPIKGQSVNGVFSFPNFKYFSNPKGETVNLTSTHLRAGNSFILECPKRLELVEPDPGKTISDHLKQFLADSPPPGKLRERIIHNTFLIKLLKEGYIIENERQVSGGRLDVLFSDKNQNLIAVEFKLRQGDSAIDQLEDYINKLQENYPKKIQGVIVCGEADYELRKRARKSDFKVIEYKLTIDMPFHQLIENKNAPKENWQE